MTQLCPNRIIRLLIVLVAVLALAACAPIQTEMESGPPAAPPPAEAPLPQVQLPPVPEFSPAECNALLPIASDFTRADDYAGAIELFDIVLGCTDSDDLKAGIYFMRAESNMQRGDWAAAVDDYRQALALGLEAADAAGARNNICWFYALDGQAEVALPFCEQAVAASPTSSYLDSRGLAYALLGRSEDAVTDFEAALVDWAASDNPQIQAIAAQRQGWVDALRGRGPDHAAGSGRTARRRRAGRAGQPGVRRGRSRDRATLDGAPLPHDGRLRPRRRGVFAGDRTRSELRAGLLLSRAGQYLAGGMARRAG